MNRYTNDKIAKSLFIGFVVFFITLVILMKLT